MKDIPSSKILLRGGIYGSIIGSLITVGFSSLSTQALSAADGVFGQYFINIVTSACGTADGVVTGFDSTSGSYGARICQSFQTMLDAKNIYARSGRIGINTSAPIHALDVNGAIRASGNMQARKWFDGDNGSYYMDPNGTSVINAISSTGDICTTQWGKTVCLDAQKGDPIYERGVSNYTGKYPTNSASTGNLGMWLKQEWDEYGRTGCQVYKDTYGTWTAANVATCQAEYPGDGRILMGIVNNTMSMAHQINYLDYQRMWGNPWIPTWCSVITTAHICDGYTQCWTYPSGYSWTAPDYLYLRCFGR